MNCFVCNGAVEETFVYNGPDPYRKVLNQDRRWFKCKNCGALNGEIVPDIERFYAEDYYDLQLADLKGMRQQFERIMNLPPENSDNIKRVSRVKSQLEEWQSKLATKLTLPPRLLDIGSGFGVFPVKFKETENSQWEITVVEPGSIACQFLNELGFTTIEGCFGDVEIDGTFDLVTLNRVLEHVHEPVSLLLKVKEVMNENSFLYLEVPDAQTLEVNGPDDDQFASTHYVVYRPESIMHALSTAGFDCLTLQGDQEPSGKLTLWSFARIKP